MNVIWTLKSFGKLTATVAVILLYSVTKMITRNLQRLFKHSMKSLRRWAQD